MHGIIFQHKEVDRTQAGGAFTVANVPVDAFYHQITVEITGAPTTGSLQVAGKVADGANFIDIGTAITITADAITQFTGHYKELRFTPTAFNGTDFDVIITSRR